MNRALLPWAVLATAIAVPFVAGGYWLYLLSLAGAYGVVAVGLNLLTGLSGQISLGHAGFFAIGAYVSTVAQNKWGVPFPLAVICAVASGWLIGLGVGFPAVRLRGLYLVIATMAFGIGVERGLYHFKDLTGGPYGLTVNSPQLFGFAFNSPERLYYLVLAFIVIAVIFAVRIMRGRPGRMLVAMRDSELAASSLGVNVPRLKVTAFAVSAALASLGGVLYAPILNFISVEHFTLWLSITFVSMIVVGGLGSIAGSFLGAAFVVVLPELLRGFGGYHQLVYGLAMIIVFVFWPTGLAGLMRAFFNMVGSRVLRKAPSASDSTEATSP
ncbi:MAG: branched-chain amino acid ABC transporter permease [Alcaligenaceae bacterium]|nr:MAG: branched-chain amino acid ABC transporter permease [Alcaligenaceae bacterium]